MRKHKIVPGPMEIVIAVVVIYAVVVATLFLMQKQLIFIPDRKTDIDALPPTLEDAEIITLQTEDGLTLRSWWMPPAEDAPVLLYFHGNAGSLLDRTERYRRLRERGYGLLALSYRGYGGNPGSPSEQGLYADARAALAYIRTQGMSDSRIILYGESLGTGVAVQLATEMMPGLIVLEAPYTSVAARGQELYPFIPVKLLIQHRFDSLRKISQVKAPLLLFHGERDTVIPVHMGRTLFEAANEPKKAMFFKDNGHNDFDLYETILVLEAFAKEHGVIHE